MKPRSPSGKKSRFRGNAVFLKGLQSATTQGKLVPQRAMKILKVMKQRDSPVQVVLFMRALLNKSIPEEMRQQLVRDLPSWEASAQSQIELGAKLLRAGKDPSLAGRSRRRP